VFVRGERRPAPSHAFEQAPDVSFGFVFVTVARWISPLSSSRRESPSSSGVSVFEVGFGGAVGGNVRKGGGGDILPRTSNSSSTTPKPPSSSLQDHSRSRRM